MLVNLKKATTLLKTVLGVWCWAHAHWAHAQWAHARWAHAQWAHAQWAHAQWERLVRVSAFVVY